MTRKIADCREYPNVRGCTLTIAGEEDEVLDAAVDHAVKTHGEERTPELRERIGATLKDEWPADEADVTLPPD